MKHLLHITLAFSLVVSSLQAQNVYDPIRGINTYGDAPTRTDRQAFASNDSVRTEGVPYGIYTWRIDERFGQIVSAEPDTVMAYFPQQVFTSGPTMRYNTTGNYGAPRMCRVYSGEHDYMQGDAFIFAKPYDYFITTPGELLYTNTKSPFTNLTYNTCGNRVNGEDRITAQFAVNSGKRIGMGFKLDYLYGRGYYANQSTSQFGSLFYGSYLGERYSMHVSYGLNYIKNSENGGLDGDEYITHPEVLATSYRTSEMPVRLEHTFNKLRVNTLLLTHHYDLGAEHIVAYDTVNAGMKKNGSDSLVVHPRLEFKPVASVIHTMRLAHNQRRFISNARGEDYFADFFIDCDTARDRTRNFSLQNTLALEMREGFRPWVKSGMRLFAKHDHEHFVLLDRQHLATSYNENYISLGAQLLREQGKLFHYNLLGELRTTGKRWGEFNVEGWAKFDIPLRRDSLSIKAYGYVRNERPSFYYRHYHGRNAWWDNDLDNIFRTRIGGELRWWRTKVRVNVENVTNYTHFAHTAQLVPDHQPLYGVGVVQASGSIQTIEATLCQDFVAGPLHWDNELTLQKSSDDKHLPLPLFTGYTNLYLKFKIAHVLATELGVDARYFSKYYAPDYNPAIGQFVTQASNARTKIGNYPWMNAYINFHLKRARFYVMYTHITKHAGNYFLTPHYPTNQRVLRFGVSWNFVN